MSAYVIFALLIALMLTGMPISIALGLTVLGFLFSMTQMPLESVALKLFTGIEKFEIMAIPFFILAGNFLTHGGVARAHDPLRHRAGRPLARRAGAGRCAGLRAVRRGLGLEPGHGGGDRLDPAAGDGQAGLPQEFRRRRDRHLGRSGHPDPAVDRDGHLRGIHQLVDRQALHRRHRAGHRAGGAADVRHLGRGEEEATIRAWRRRALPKW